MDNQNILEVSFTDLQKEILTKSMRSDKFLADFLLKYDNSGKLDSNNAEVANQKIYRKLKLKPKRMKAKNRSHYIPTKRYRKPEEINNLETYLFLKNYEGLSNEERESFIVCCASRNIMVCPPEMTMESLPTVTCDEVDSRSTQAKVIYHCHLCDEYSTDQFSELYRHLRNHQILIDRARNTDNQLIQQIRDNCPICGYELLRSDLRSHLTLHIDNVRCKICHDFVTNAEVCNHMSKHKHHSQCSICGCVLVSKLSTTRHFLMHRTHPEFECDQCDYKFFTLSKLVAHINTSHMYIDPVYGECIYCWQLTNQLRYHVDYPMKCKYKCKICYKKITPVELFATHIKGHLTDQSMECEQEIKDEPLS